MWTRVRCLICGYKSDTKLYAAFINVTLLCGAFKSFIYSYSFNVFFSMVSSYLVHHGYCATAMAFARATETMIQEDQASIKNRQSKNPHANRNTHPEPPHSHHLLINNPMSYIRTENAHGVTQFCHDSCLFDRYCREHLLIDV